tara:strand:+ start:1099 stop:1806 length:708 start_codon:yes stop_codon:yes gene_type:complete
MAMEWPSHAFANSLFPSLTTSPVEIIPKISNDVPAWHILDPESNDSLKQQLLKLTQATLDLIDKKKLPETVTFDESKGPVMIEVGAVIEPSTHFIGPCFVGKDATIRHGAYIRENAWICSHALVGHCSEVKHSILLPYSKAPHFNYVGDSILGKSVNLGAGVKLSNLRNDGTEVYLRIEKSRIGSGLRKFGAILGEGCQLGCNAVTNPGTVLGINSVVWPNVTVTGVHGQSSTHR